MCYLKRLIYGQCNHSAPLGMEAICINPRHCDGVRAHPLATLRIEEMCPTCKENRVKVDNNLTVINERIRRMKDVLARSRLKEEDGESAGSRSRSGTASTVGSDSDAADVSLACGSAFGSTSDAASPLDVERHMEDEKTPNKDEQAADEKTSVQSVEGKTVPTDEPASSCTSPPPPPPTATSLKRDDKFIAGVCLSSMILTATAEKRQTIEHKAASQVDETTETYSGLRPCFLFDVNSVCIREEEAFPVEEEASPVEEEASPVKGEASSVKGEASSVKGEASSAEVTE